MPVLQWVPPAPGTVIDEYKKRTPDPLNEFYFIVRISSTAQSRNGVYDLLLAWGPNEHKVTLTMPKWTKGVTLKPMLKPDTGRYHCYVGFSAGDDTFHEFYEVKVDHRDIEYKQTKAYYLEPSQ
jgi:hypothetical protein